MSTQTADPPLPLFINFRCELSLFLNNDDKIMIIIAVHTKRNW